MEWTADDTATVHKLHGQGVSLARIADAVGRTREAVRNRLRTTPAPKADRSRESQLEKIIEQQAAELSRARAPRTIRRVKPSKPERGDFRRVIIPDSHGCQIDPEARDAFLADLEQLNPREIVMTGDHIDCGGFLAQHHTLGYVAETSYTFADDVAAANEFLDAIQAAAPNATIYYLEGNHERRIEKWICTQTLAHQADARFLASMFSTEVVLHLERRGIAIFKQGEKYHGLPIPATIKLGKCHFTHSDGFSKHAAAALVSKYGANVVYGHTHRADSYIIRTVGAGTVGAWNPGCLCRLQPYFNHTAPTDHSHGYGVQSVRETGEFMHINVPIVDGKSMLMLMMNQPHKGDRKCSRRNAKTRSTRQLA